MFNNLVNQWKYKRQKSRFGGKAKGTPLAALYNQSFPNPKQGFKETRFLVADSEMSGLDSAKDNLLSLGWVVIENGKILNKSAGHILINAKGGAGDSVMVHGLHDHMLEQGRSKEEALSAFVKQAEGAVLVFHHAALDLKFLQQAALELFDCPFLLPYIDTMEIEQARLSLQGKSGGFRLQQCRDRYGLPPYLAHNALNDALGTADLFLAQVHHRGKLNSIILGDLMLRCS